MEAEENTNQPYTVISPDSKSFFVEYEQQRNQVNITAPQEAIAMQQNVNAGPGMLSSTVLPNQTNTVLVPVGSRGSDLTFPAIIVCFFCCWCTGIPAIFYASKAQSEYGAGNFLEAEKNQRLARRWMIVSVFANVAFWVAAVLIVFFVLIFPNMI